MKMVLKPVLAALVAAGFGAGAQAQSVPDVKFSGFGTLGFVHSSEEHADFVGTIFQPNGAGATKSWAYGVDSKLGAQVDAKFSDSLSGVIQLVAQHNPDNTYTPKVEWANVKFQATPELSLRLGRIAAPSFLVSDTRFVGYAQPWVRPPVEVYGVLPITTNDGVDATWRKQFGGMTNAVQAYYGSTKAKLKTGSAESNPGWGINDTVQAGDLTLRAGYTYNETDINFPGINTLLGGITAFTAIPGPVGAQARALAEKYSVKDMKLKAISLGANYDPGQWFAMGEFVDLRGEGILADSRSWYVAGGYRFGSFTPYATYATTKSKVANEPGIPFPPAAPINAA